MRLPNNYGTVALIDKKSKRRKPYVVKVHTGWTDDGKAIRKTLGYVETRKKGYQMLAEYHDKPYDLDNNNVSFAFLYDKWFNYKIASGLSAKTLSKYKFYKAKYEHILTKPFIDISRGDLQTIVDNCSGNGNYKHRIINLYHQMHEYATGNNIKVGNDISKFVIIEKTPASTLHKPFTNEEIEWLWNNRNEIIDIILINIYTGIRPGEFFCISEVNDEYFITGSKTESGRNRVIPYNNKIKDIFKNTYNSHILDEIENEDRLYHRFKNALKNTELSYHTPYDSRHTFATLMDRAKADKHCIKLLMGHRIEDLTERVYTHKVIDELKSEINKI